MPYATEADLGRPADSAPDCQRCDSADKVSLWNPKSLDQTNMQDPEATLQMP